MFKLFRLSLLLPLGLAAAGCQTATQSPIARVEFDQAGRPITPGVVGIRIVLPDREKWLARFQAGKNGAVTRIFACRELACPSRSVVVIETSASPSRVIDPIALQKLAKDLGTQSRTDQDDVREALGAIPVKRKIISSKATKIQGRPGILQEIELEQDGKKLSSVLGVMFAGPVLVKFNSLSGDMNTARRHYAQFVAAFTITEPGSAAPMPAPTGVTATSANPGTRPAVPAAPAPAAPAPAAPVEEEQPPA